MTFNDKPFHPRSKDDILKKPKADPELPVVPAPNQPSPVHLAELMALAATIRQCQRNGHPDLSKHLEILLTKLGA